MTLVDFNNPVLRIKAQPVDVSNLAVLADFANSLKNTMKELSKPAALGLALPQIGIGYRGFALGPKLFNPETWTYCFNPVVIGAIGMPMPGNEGCFSIGGGKKRFMVNRPLHINVQYWNRSGKPVEQILLGMAARCFQHELDHLNGVLICDIGTPVK